MLETNVDLSSVASKLNAFFLEPQTCSSLLAYESVKEYVAEKQVQEMRRQNFGALEYVEDLKWHYELKLIEPIEYWLNFLLNMFDGDQETDFNRFVNKWLYDSNLMLEKLYSELRVTVDILVITHDIFNRDDRSLVKYDVDGSCTNFSYKDKIKLEGILTRNYDSADFIEYLIIEGNGLTDDLIHQAKIDFLNENSFPKKTDASLMDWSIRVERISSITKNSEQMFSKYFDKMVGSGSVEDFIQKIDYSYGKRLDYEFYIENFEGNFEVFVETNMTSSEHRREYSNDNPIFIKSADDDDESDAKRQFIQSLKKFYSEKEIRNYLKNEKKSDILNYIRELSLEYLMEHEAEERTIHLDYVLKEKINWCEVSEKVYDCYKKEVIDDLDSPMFTYEEYVVDFYYKNRELELYVDNFTSYFTVIFKER